VGCGPSGRNKCGAVVTTENKISRGVFARARKAVRAIRARAEEEGSDTLTLPDIQREVKAARRALKRRARRSAGP